MPGLKGGISASRKKVLLALLVGVLFVAWFFPWVLTVPAGFTLYFPYDETGEDRYPRLVGPLPAVLGFSDWVSQEQMPQACRDAAVAAEDTRFYEHMGIDWQSMNAAFSEDRKRLRGASTITQQLVKNLYLSRDRSWVRKAREAAGALMLDAIVPKDWILTWYLNVIEWGPRVYGISHAARHYFKKRAKELTADECVQLAAIIPHPTNWNRSLITGQETPFFQSRMRVISRRMQIMGMSDYPGFRLARPAPLSEGEREEEGSPEGEAPDLDVVEEPLLEQLMPLPAAPEPLFEREENGENTEQTEFADEKPSLQ